MSSCFKCGKTLNPEEVVHWPLGAAMARCLDCVLAWGRGEHRANVSVDLLHRLAAGWLYGPEAKYQWADRREPEEYVCPDCGWRSGEFPLDARCPTCAVTPCDCHGVLDCPDAEPLGAIY